MKYRPDNSKCTNLQPVTLKQTSTNGFVKLITAKLHNWVQVKNTYVQLNFSGSNTDGSFTTAVSNSCFSP